MGNQEQMKSQKSRTKWHFWLDMLLLRNDLLESRVPGQVDTAVGHVLSAVGYLFEDATAPFAPGAEKLILNSGHYLGGLNPRVSAELSRLGSSIMEADEEVVVAMARDAGIAFSTVLENTTIYNRLSSGHVDMQQLQNWLLNTPVRRTVSE